MKISSYISLFLFLFVCRSVIAETTAGKKLLMKPMDYYSPTGKLVSEKSKAMDPQLSHIWIVFSDRDNNPTYSFSDGKTQFKKAGFADAFFVIGDNGNYLHIVKFDNSPSLWTPDFKLKKDLEDFGWMPKANLLLWNKSLEDEGTHFSIKALTVKKPESLANLPELVKDKNLKLFNDPSVQSNTINKKDLRIFEFLYVYKKDEVHNTCLVGTSIEILKVQSGVAGDILLGWVSNAVVTEWKNRVTLEKNNDPAAVAERQAKNIKISISKSPAGAEQLKATGKVSQDELLDNQDPGVPQSPQEKRLPFFPSPAGGTWVKTGYITPVLDMQGHTVMNLAQQAEMLTAYEKALAEFKKINIVFVVDGSEIIKPYAPAILDIVSRTANRLTEYMANGEEEDKVEYKIGAVVYRDYIEKDCEKGNITDFQVQKLTKNFTDVSSFFQNDVTYGNCKDKDPRQALYMGMSKAADLFKDRDQQSNIIIVIGAGANHNDDKQINQQELVKKLAQYNCPVFAFQVKSPSVLDHDAYDDFQKQFRELILNLSNTLRDKHNKQFPDMATPGAVSFDRIDSIANLFKLNSPKLSPIPSAYMFPDELNSIDPDKLTLAFLTMIDEFRASQKEILQSSQNQVRGQGERGVPDEGVLNFFTKINVDPAILKKAAFTNIQLFVEGYASVTCDKLTNPLYNYTIFVSLDELATLIGELHKIADGGQDKSKRRQNIQDAFIYLLGLRIGAKEAKAKIHTLDVEHLLSELSGRGVRPDNILNKVHIADITDTKKVKDELLDNMTQEIQNKLVELERYESSDDKSFSSNSIKYFWVPESMLP